MHLNSRTGAQYAGPLLLFGIFGLYLVTLAPSVTFWDSGELITAACTLGIPHQPGYPLYGNLGRLFSLLPFGNAALRLNLLSALFSAISVYLVYRTILALSDRPAGPGPEAGTLDVLLAAPVALALGVSAIFWSQAVVSEVYAPGGFFVALLLHTHVLGVTGRLEPLRYMALSAFLFGLGVVNHVSLLLYLPALALSWAAAAGRGPGIRGYVVGLFFFLLGLSVMIYLPLRSAAGPELNIGHPDTWPDFLWTIKLDDYVQIAGQLAGNAAGLVGKMDLADWRLLAGVPALAVCAWLLVRRSPRLYLAPVTFLVLYAAVVSAQALGSERDIRFGLPPKFFIPALMTGAVLAGGLARSAAASGRGRAARLAALLAAAVTATALTAGYRNHYPNDYSRNFMALDYAANSLKSVGERGVLLTWGDNGVFPLWYLRTVERYRDDTVLVHTPLMTYGWHLEDVTRWMGGDPGFASPYFLGENVYRLLKAAGPGRTFSYDYSSTRYLKLDEKTLTLYGLVYYEGPAPGGDPWPWYVFRGVEDPSLFKGGMEKNIIKIYRYQAKMSARHPAGLFERP